MHTIEGYKVFQSVDRDLTKSRIELGRLTVPDAIVILLIMSLSLALIVHATIGSRPSAKPTEASIYHDGQLIKHLSLEKDQQMLLNEGKMLIEIKDGRVRIVRSDCPRQVCVRVGWVAHPGEAITCVPYKTVIEIGSTRKTAIDAVVF